MMIITRNGTMIRMPVDGVRITGRSAQGVKLIDLAEDDVVMSATPVEPMDEDDEPASSETAGAAIPPIPAEAGAALEPPPPVDPDAIIETPPPTGSNAPEEGMDR